MNPEYHALESEWMAADLAATIAEQQFYAACEHDPQQPLCNSEEARRVLALRATANVHWQRLLALNSGKDVIGSEIERMHAQTKTIRW